jgi:hypothetical protein
LHDFLLQVEPGPKRMKLTSQISLWRNVLPIFPVRGVTHVSGRSSLNAAEAKLLGHVDLRRPLKLGDVFFCYE